MLIKFYEFYFILYNILYTKKKCITLLCILFYFFFSILLASSKVAWAFIYYFGPIKKEWVEIFVFFLPPTLVKISYALIQKQQQMYKSNKKKIVNDYSIHSGENWKI